MHAAMLAKLTKNATIFWEHEVFVYCCDSNTAIYIFSVFFFQKTVKIMKKISLLILVLLIIFLFCHLYFTMPNMSFNLV